MAFHRGTTGTVTPGLEMGDLQVGQRRFTGRQNMLVGVCPRLMRADMQDKVGHVSLSIAA